MKELLDISGAILAGLSTICFIRMKPIGWPISLLAISISLVLFYRIGLYGDMSINVIYFVMGLYGWYEWKFGGVGRSELPIANLNKRIAIPLFLIAILLLIAVFYLLKFHTDSKVPCWDTITTVLSLLAYWMSTRKIIENWLVWFVVDAMYVGLYVYKGIPAHCVLNILYVGMAVTGYLNWQRLRLNVQEIPA